MTKNSAVVVVPLFPSTTVTSATLTPGIGMKSVIRAMADPGLIALFTGVAEIVNVSMPSTAWSRSVPIEILLVVWPGMNTTCCEAGAK